MGGPLADPGTSSRPGLAGQVQLRFRSRQVSGPEPGTRPIHVLVFVTRASQNAARETGICEPRGTEGESQRKHWAGAPRGFRMPLGEGRADQSGSRRPQDRNRQPPIVLHTCCQEE
jgi:hypothetical protein